MAHTFFGGPKCEPHDKWVTNSDEFDDLKSIQVSDDEGGHKREAQYSAEKDIQDPHLEVEMQLANPT